MNYQSGFTDEDNVMQVLNIFSWLPAKEISLEQLEQIFVEYHNGIYNEEYNISFETPSYVEKDILNCRAELIEEGNNIGYILKDGHIIAVIGYKE
jgi:hypothetical protein